MGIKIGRFSPVDEGSSSAKSLISTCKSNIETSFKSSRVSTSTTDCPNYASVHVVTLPRSGDTFTYLQSRTLIDTRFRSQKSSSRILSTDSCKLHPLSCGSDRKTNCDLVLVWTKVVHACRM